MLYGRIRKNILILPIVIIIFLILKYEIHSKTVEYLSVEISNSYNYSNNTKNKKCPYVPTNLTGPITLNLTSLTITQVEIALSTQGIRYGGFWEPKDCDAIHHIAILITFRDRDEHLNAFLLNMHPLFAKHKLAYKIYLIEPYGNLTFNKGILYNVGFIESNKDSNWQCHCYHDVDLLSEDDRTLYTCSQSPRHLAQFINKYNYKMNYWGRFGGVSILDKEHYIKANGYSNLFFKWGSEDDDHLKRLEAKFLTASFYTQLPYGKYYMFKHTRHEINQKRGDIMVRANNSWYNEDGLNTVKYKVMDTIKTPLYTKFVIYYDQKEYEQILHLFLKKYSRKSQSTK